MLSRYAAENDTSSLPVLRATIAPARPMLGSSRLQINILGVDGFPTNRPIN
jgi:hypothetical protein